MAGNLMFIPNDDTQNYPFCRLQLVVKTFEHSSAWNNQNGKSPKFLGLQRKKTVLIEVWELAK